MPKPEPYLDEDGKTLSPRLKRNLASVDNPTLGRLMTEYTAAAEYAAYAAAIADIDRSVERSILDFVEAKIRLTKSGTVQKKADKAMIDPHVVAAKQAFLEKDAIATLTATIAKSFERAIQTISREITRRQSELDRQ